MDPKDKQTLLIAVYKENAEQARHHEQQRGKITSIVAQTTGVILGLLTVSKEGTVETHALYVLIAGFLIVLGILGSVIILKHSERAELHRKRIGRIRERLSDLSGEKLKELNIGADAEHEQWD